MKVKERVAAKKGGYKAQFQELIRPDNKVGLKKGKDDKQRVLFRLVSDKGEQIPCGFIYDFDDPRTIGALATLGVPADKMKELGQGSATKALIFFEKVAQKKALPVSIYVREDGAFGSGLRPLEGKFPIKFTGVLSRDKDTKKPIWTFRPGKQGINRKTGGTYMNPDINAFDIGWVVKSGPAKGALFRTSEHYAIMKDEDDEWLVDAETGPGRGFNSLLVWHKIDPKTLNPDKHFDNPENGLPELEKMWLKRADKTNLEITVSADKRPIVKEAESLASGSEDEDSNEPVDVGEEEFKADTNAINLLFSAIDRRVKKKSKVSAWASDGELSKSGRLWVKEYLRPIMIKKKMPAEFEDLDTHQTKLLTKVIKARFPL